MIEPLAVLGRYLLVALGSVAISRGWVTSAEWGAVTNLITQVVAGLATFAPIAYGMWKRWRTVSVSVDSKAGRVAANEKS